MKLGVVGGSGLYEMEGLEVGKLERVSTPYGPPSADYRVGRYQDVEVVFLPRHGVPHSIPPHRVNYRANIFGFRELGVTQILSISATGAVNPDLKPGALVLLDQIVDLTSGRETTFFDGPRIHHVDFTVPYCSEMQDIIEMAGKETGVPLQRGGTYVCTNGPRLETAAEIRLYSGFGADVVGMTGMPEAVLARELEICFGALSVVTNMAAGLTVGRLTTREVVGSMRDAHKKLSVLLTGSFRSLCLRPRSCDCGSALQDSSL